jgi:hypothetical protein
MTRRKRQPEYLYGNSIEWLNYFGHETPFALRGVVLDEVTQILAKGREMQSERRDLVADEKILGTLTEGDVVRIDGQKYTIQSIARDSHNSMQVTFLSQAAVNAQRMRDER